MSIMGHRNSASLQSYQRPNIDQTIAMALILDGNSSEEDLPDIGLMEVGRLLSGLKEDDLCTEIDMILEGLDNKSLAVLEGASPSNRHISNVNFAGANFTGASNVTVNINSSK